MTVEQIENLARFEAHKHEIAASIRRTLDRAKEELIGDWDEIESEILALVTDEHEPTEAETAGELVAAGTEGHDDVPA